MIVSSLLSRFPWLEHGFGTRDSFIDQDAMASLRQIHSANVLRVAGVGCAGEADALITNQPGVAVSVRTADCFPLLLVDGERRATAAVHAGWRGTAEEIARRAIEKMTAEFGTRAADLSIAIGPGIGECCYRVGADVARKLGIETRQPAVDVDLAAINRAQIIAAGVAPDRIDTIGGCTFCEEERFFSYRREKENAGRMISFARIRL